MEPTLPNGCSILVDYNRRRLRVGRIFVVCSGGRLVVRRALKDRAGGWLLGADDQGQTPVPWDRCSSEVVGEVRWVAKTLAG